MDKRYSIISVLRLSQKESQTKKKALKGFAFHWKVPELLNVWYKNSLHVFNGLNQKKNFFSVHSATKWVNLEAL